jgi:hypothetical protein
MASDTGARRFGRGGGQGAGLGSKYSVVFLAVVICILNLYMYLSPGTRKAAAGGDGGGVANNLERPSPQASGPDPSSFLAKKQPEPSKQQQQQQQQREQKQVPAAASGSSSSSSRKAEAAAGTLEDRALSRDKSRKKNVLFIMTDDLRPSLSVYDKPVVTPAFERLARGGVVFERAYNQDPICNPSRNSLLSGRRPDTTRTWLFENTVPHDYSNIFKYFKDEGQYKVYGAGKLWHWTRCAWVDGWMDGWMDGCMDALMDGWMGGWVGGWMDGWVDWMRVCDWWAWHWPAGSLVVGWLVG